ncbi:hypothetical protein LPB140_11055 [Sphingorhabdus lutea]|uniref:Uncharacterized protein n=1 Tax=Sphingorhabdus lutea TaxID=1913578 RepID=A0A1L3JDM2_9SPHN|nr:phage tail protein [Sphingorhabdus lutea]APG63234.1 hypothetical protein LPB140_11055 [Sphingorhabdus lutea]
MATIALTLAGTAIGGPIGGAIGSILGGQVDNAIFGKPKIGAGRLKELDVQTSTYGAAIPKIYGTMRVAGSVIWASDLIENKVKSGGKGQANSVNYSYSANFAVAIASNHIKSIGRIWADGKLLRGAAGDLKTGGMMRFYPGDEQQQADPLLLAAQGMDKCPAFRGICYVVFEGLQLADFGNRIPSLSFELFEDEQHVSLNRILNDIAPNMAGSTSDEQLIGYQIIQENARDALADLASFYSGFFTEKNGKLYYSNGRKITDYAIGKEYIISVDNKKISKPEHNIGAVGDAPSHLLIRYYAPERDYLPHQVEVQRPGQYDRHLNIDFPATLNMQQAQCAAMAMLNGHYDARHIWTAMLPRHYKKMAVGSIISVHGDPFSWLITETQQNLAGNLIKARRYSDMAAMMDNLSNMPDMQVAGHIAQFDDVHGPTILRAFAAPIFDAQYSHRPMVAIAANGAQHGWRRAAIFVENAAGDALVQAESIAQNSITGDVVQAVLAPAKAEFWDLKSRIIVQLDRKDDILVGASNADILSNKYLNLARIGEEFVQFATCQPRGDGRFELSSFLRGRFASDEAIFNHMANEQFLLIEQNRMNIIDIEALLPAGMPTSSSSDSAVSGEENLSRLDGMLHIEAQGLGDEMPVEAQIANWDKFTRPLRPVHPAIYHHPTDGTQISWQRRSRIDNGWRDYVDIILDEPSEKYQISAFVNGGVNAPNNAQKIELSFTDKNNFWLLDSEKQAIKASLNIPPDELLGLEVRQMGENAPSAPLIFLI